MSPEFFINNRKKLRSHVATKLIVLAGNDEMQRRADAAFPFVQDAYFYYLTGINEAGWKFVSVNEREILVAPTRSEAQTLFDGSLKIDEVRQQTGITEIIDTSQWRKLLKELEGTHHSVATLSEDPHAAYYTFSQNPGPVNNAHLLHKHFAEVEDIRPVLNKMRAIKQPEEIKKIRQAVHISVKAFEHIKMANEPWMSEAHVAAQITYDFLAQGSGGHAYDPIVAFGMHACTLHYMRNDGDITPGGLLLIDAGALDGEYAADITRTYAMGKPADRQREIHSAVEKAHRLIIELIKPGVTLKSYLTSVDEIMKDALVHVGLLKDRSDNDTYRKYFPHAISHGLGIDVHESLGGYKKFMPGMVLTVEPGIYIPEEGIGVRIEDDILVTKTGNENLSQALSTSL